MATRFEFARRYVKCRKDLQAEGTGLETTTDSSENQGSLQVGDTKSDTVAEFAQIDATDWASLQIVKIAWPHLRQGQKRRILSIIRQASTPVR